LKKKKEKERKACIVGRYFGVLAWDRRKPPRRSSHFKFVSRCDDHRYNEIAGFLTKWSVTTALFGWVQFSFILVNVFLPGPWKNMKQD